MAKVFHYFTLEEIYQFAKDKGYNSDDVEIRAYIDEDGEKGYQVSFGREYTEVWDWYFDDLSQSAIDYDHNIWED